MTVYVPALTGEIFVKDGFCRAEVNPDGPVQLIGEEFVPDMVTLSMAQYQLYGASYLKRI